MTPSNVSGRPISWRSQPSDDLFELGRRRRRPPQHRLLVERGRQELGEHARRAAGDREVGEEARMVPVREAGHEHALEVGEDARRTARPLPARWRAAPRRCRRARRARGPDSARGARGSRRSSRRARGRAAGSAAGSIMTYRRWCGVSALSSRRRTRLFARVRLRVVDRELLQRRARQAERGRFFGRLVGRPSDRRRAA